MNNINLYKDIAQRTNGDIYLGVVGPVRTGKSTFIKRFMDTMVLPNIDDEFSKERATDELPQSAQGRTIMTTEPKFIPENAVQMKIDDNSFFKIRLIDCVGYIVPSSLGYIENNQPRMVKTPWFEKEIPFNMAAEIGTQKVITEHSTIGLVVTTDGSVTDIPREEYKEAEVRVINELKELNKPFSVLLNCVNPDTEQSRETAKALSVEYGVKVRAVNCQTITENEFSEILSDILSEFPTKQINFSLPLWVGRLPKEHKLRSSVFGSIRDISAKVKKIHDIEKYIDEFTQNEYITGVRLIKTDLAYGTINVDISMERNLFYEILTEQTGIEIKDDRQLIEQITELSNLREKYKRFESALNEVNSTGYGIVMPTSEEMTLETPEIMKQGGKYGVRLKASAPSIHMMKANITTEVAPVVGSEEQSEELVMYLMNEFDDDPSKIWESNIFGKTLNSLVNEGLHNKLYKMPVEARNKIQETLERVINEKTNGLICILL